uniref:PID domain-containing protein n=1 Tax=Amphimedon queenslandica TaxID=400682 RepID=A0A1X7UY71_AMPQE
MAAKAPGQLSTSEEGGTLHCTGRRLPVHVSGKYPGQGLQFRVKYVGSKNVNRRRGDAEAARYCLPTLRTASKNMRAHKPKAVLGLNLKGVSLYDERSKYDVMLRALPPNKMAAKAPGQLSTSEEVGTLHCTGRRLPVHVSGKYPGQGLQFRVKYVGSKNVNRRRGDAEAARYCLPTLR